MTQFSGVLFGSVGEIIAPSREEVVVGVEGLFTWDLAGRLVGP
jgi:hypothetical protein